MLLHYLKHQQEDIENALPQLEGLYKLPKNESHVRLFKGPKGVKAVFMIYYFGSEGQLNKRLPYFCPHFVNENMKRKRKIRVIKRFGGSANPDAHTEVRWVPEGISSNVVTNIYDDKNI